MSIISSGILSKEQRDALPASSFAISGRRLLPIHDAAHVKLSWGTVDRVLASDEEKVEARIKIIKAAKEFGVNTAKWHLNAVAFSAMSLEFPETPDHPNKLPFTGILTRLDEPSTRPLSGTGGKRVIMPTAVAEAALASLLGMSVDFTPTFDGHNPKNKIGLITSAEIEGNAIKIAGFFYAADFPEEVARIQADKDDLGFSFEAQSYMQSMKANPLTVVSCEFTGAAVLYKDAAAYQDTSIAANADLENTMDAETKAALEAMQGTLTTLTSSLTTIAASVEALGKKVPAAAASIAPMVTTHCAALRQCAQGLAAAGIGMHSTAGHVAVLNKMADTMEAEAALGRIPHVYRDHDFLSAYGSDGNRQTPEQIAAAAKEAEEKQNTAFAALLKPVTDGLAAMGTKLTDFQAKLDKAPIAAAAADRKTLPAALTQALARMQLTAGGEDGKTKIKVADFDAAAQKVSMPRQQSMAMKMSLREAGLLESNA